MVQCSAVIKFPVFQVALESFKKYIKIFKNTIINNLSLFMVVGDSHLRCVFCVLMDFMGVK